MPTCARSIVVIALFLLTTAGCSIPHKVGVNETGAPQYRQVDISYRIPASHRAIVRKNAVVRTSREERVNGVNQSTAMLRIQYPHPQDKPNMARATLRIGDKQESAPTTSVLSRIRSGISWLPGSEPPTPAKPSVDDDVWTFDVPRQQLDLMLADLAHSGFFEDQNRHEGTAHLSIAIDRGRVAKTWSPEARLDDVVLRVQREGWHTGGRDE